MEKLQKFSYFLVFLSLFLSVIPVEWFIFPSMRLQEKYRPAMYLDHIQSYSGSYPTKIKGYQPLIHIGPLGFLAIITPTLESDLSDLKGKEIITNDDLIQWYDENGQWINETIAKYGGIILRNFNIKTPVDFDNFVGHIHPDITTDIYLGTTPRYRVNGTRFIFTASEAPKIVSIPTHIELSFSPAPPPRIYFFAHVINSKPGGNTPITDFAQVWTDLSPALKDKIAHKGLVYERWYRHEKNPANDPLVHKTWQAMFLTDNKTVVREMALAQGYNPTWDEKDDLLLKHQAIVTRTNKQTGREFWCTHFNVLHAQTVAVPYAWDAQLLRSKTSALIALIFHLVVNGRHLLGYHYGANTLYGNGETESEMEWDEAMHIREIISKNTWIFDYEQGDVVMLDNHRLAHGRTPWFTGKRSVLVAYH
jgi:alpha-ketoglutarate-dependent taurine dioxygenase